MARRGSHRSRWPINPPEGFGRVDFSSATHPRRVRTNLDELDRIVRGTAGVWLVFVAVSAARDRRRATAAIAGIAGIGLVQNALVGYCGANRLCGIDTTDDCPEAER